MVTRRKAIRIDDAIGVEISAVDHPANKKSRIESVEIAKGEQAIDFDPKNLEALGITEPGEVSGIRKFFSWLQRKPAAAEAAPADKREELGMTLSEKEEKTFKALLEKIDKGELVMKADGDDRSGIVNELNKKIADLTGELTKAKETIEKGTPHADASLAQGCHDALAAAGAPPHNVSEGGDDTDEKMMGKLDSLESLITKTEGIDPDVQAVMKWSIEKARFGKKVAASLDKAHQFVTKLGAKCDAADMGKSETLTPEQRFMFKMLEQQSETLKALVGKKTEADPRDAVIIALNKRLEALEAQPAGSSVNPNLRIFAVDKSGKTEPVGGSDKDVQTQKADDTPSIDKGFTHRPPVQDLPNNQIVTNPNALMASVKGAAENGSRNISSFFHK